MWILTALFVMNSTIPEGYYPAYRPSSSASISSFARKYCLFAPLYTLSQHLKPTRLLSRSLIWGFFFWWSCTAFLSVVEGEFRGMGMRIQGVESRRWIPELHKFRMEAGSCGLRIEASWHILQYLRYYLQTVLETYASCCCISCKPFLLHLSIYISIILFIFLNKINIIYIKDLRSESTHDSPTPSLLLREFLNIQSSDKAFTNHPKLAALYKL
jgi:hypothetical protein